MNRRARGFTLLETLLAITLIATVLTLSGSWIIAAQRTARTGQQRLEVLTAAESALGALRDDLRGAVTLAGTPRLQIVDGALTMATLHLLPGDAPGLHRVTWRHDAEGGGVLLRERAPLDLPAAATRPAPRAITGHVSQFAFGYDETDPVLWVTVALAADPALALRLAVPVRGN